MVSTSTVEENILKKATQKQLLDSVVIQAGGFTTDFFKKVNIADLLGADVAADAADGAPAPDALIEAAPAQAAAAAGAPESGEVDEDICLDEEDRNERLQAQRYAQEEANEFDESLPLNAEDGEGAEGAAAAAGAVVPTAPARQGSAAALDADGELLEEMGLGDQVAAAVGGDGGEVDVEAMLNPIQR